jgi:MFS family permease
VNSNEDECLITSDKRPGELKLAFTLSTVIAFRMLGLFLILPVFMVLARDVPGFTPQLGGIAVGIYGLTQAILQQPFGWLSDRWGRRPVLLMGLLLFALGGVVAALADSMPQLIAGRALQGCGAIAGVAMAFAADFTRPERRPISMAIIGMGIGGAFLLSMMLAVPLASLLGLGGLFWLTSILGFGGMLLVLLTPRGTPLADDETGSDQVNMKPVWLLALSVFLLHGVMTLLFVVLPPMLVGQYDFLLSQHWKIYVPTMVVSILIVLPVLRKTGRTLSEHRMLPAAFLALSLSMGLIALKLPLIGLGLLLIAYFVGFNLLEAGMPSLLSRVAGSRGRGRRMGLYSTFQFLGAFAGGVIGGSLLGLLGSEAALAVAAVACLLWFGIIQAMSKRHFLTSGAA